MLINNITFFIVYYASYYDIIHIFTHITVFYFNSAQSNLCHAKHLILIGLSIPSSCHPLFILPQHIFVSCVICMYHEHYFQIISIVMQKLILLVLSNFTPYSFRIVFLSFIYISAAKTNLHSGYVSLLPAVRRNILFIWYKYLFLSFIITATSAFYAQLYCLYRLLFIFMNKFLSTMIFFVLTLLTLIWPASLRK